MANPRLAADGSRNPVIVIGTQEDGTPALDQMVLNFDRPGAGSYNAPAVTLGPLGATSVFMPCDFATPGCAGPLALTAALAAAPNTPLAHVDVELVDPIEVNPARPCLVGGNVLYLKGNDQIFNGETTITGATWTINSGFQNYLDVRVTPAGATGDWRLVFDSRVYSPYLIADGYENAQRSLVVTSPMEIDRPSMEISGFGNQCTTLTGRFDVVEYTVGGNGVENITIAFEQHCEASTTTVLAGCLHYQP